VAELISYAKTHSYHKMVYPHWSVTVRWPITVWFTLLNAVERVSLYSVKHINHTEQEWTSLNCYLGYKSIKRETVLF